MPAPSPVSKTITETTAGVNGYSLNLPATINAGDRLVAFLMVEENPGLSSTATDSTSDTWTVLLSPYTSDAGRLQIGVWEKIADGDEDSGTLDVTWTGTEPSVGFVIRITGAHATTASEAAAGASVVGGSTTPDPGSVTASWGAEDNLFIAICGHEADISSPTGPSGYTFNTTEDTDWAQTGTTATDAHAMCATLESTATATSDPGTFGSVAFGRWATTTVVVRPAGGAAAMTRQLINGGLINQGLINAGLIG